MTAVIVLAAIAATAPTLAAIAALVTALRAEKTLSVQGKKLEVVHELVNSRLTAALDKIDRLEERLHGLTGIRPSGEPPPIPSLNKPTDLIPRREPPQQPVSGDQPKEG